MLIYRIEDDDGTGMYFSTEFVNPMQNMDGRHPTPSNDSGMDDAWSRLDFGARQNFSFGFVSMDQLNMWVYQEDWRIELQSNGFHISVYECPNSCAIVGYTQVVFLKNNSKFIKKMEFSEIM